ncbi:RNA polymerase sigma factor [Luteolibacter marinus]|uniref:RNA polymerase sigma factor n=1 Tax=Luteolibacter marinus TaxID=2776705 RepID=UPI001865E3DA|nr:sigma-70 family RNA polymerase sigma factor [Luteolibacter marinus]
MDPSDPNPTFFATTRWTLVGQAVRGGDDTVSATALESIFSTYWQPLYRYARRRGHKPEDAEDLVQGFFAHLLAGNGLRLVDQDRGRFRAFMLGAMANYMANEWRREHRQKRGGFADRLSIDWKDAESGLGLEVEDGRSPDRAFDREWAQALLAKVLRDMAEDEEDFGAWEPYLAMSGEQLPYAEMCARFGMTENAARVAVHRLRKRYRQRVRDEIARTLENREMVDEEMRVLFSALAEDFS